MKLSWSQGLTLAVTMAYLATSAIHYQGNRKPMAMMFLGYSVANIGAFLLEGAER